MKICSKCSKELEFNLFRKSSKSKDGFQVWCTPCMKQYEQERYQNGDRARKEKNKIASRERARIFVWEYLQQHSCIDCGEDDPVVLEFDHRDGVEKKFNIGESYDFYSVSKISEELDKCDVRCANCHRRRTAKQFETWKFVKQAMV